MTLLSSSSLFHYTKSLETLIAILKTGFRFSSVSEPYPQMSVLAKIDVVCFCDIPLTQAIDHRENYGKYAIGLSNSWAIKNKISPVRYVHSNSPGFSKEVIEFMDLHEAKLQNGNEFVQQRVALKNKKTIDIEKLPNDAMIVIETLENDLTKALEFISSGVPFLKAYKENSKKYYDEREWRASCLPGSRGNNLKFLWEDINFIICDSEDETTQIYNQLKKEKSTLEIKSENKIWKKLYTFKEIVTNF
ncbi:MAG: hypothetical protein KKD21_13230 [Proteobacteria bacterium]|nr:hypothetical protein [Pseudomonadota bacterium]MBU1697982.1 hypothetical protein [Pseudomonadota bacterium]